MNSIPSFICLSGYLFSDEIVESIEKHGQEVAESVVKTAKSVYDEMKNVRCDIDRSHCLQSE